MKWPDQLVRSLANRRAVLFFGAGASKNSTTPDGTRKPKAWKEFLRHANSKCEKRSIKKAVASLIHSGDYLTACDVIARSLGREEFGDLVKEEYFDPGFRPSQFHELMWKLDLRILITPNFDNIFDTLVSDRGGGTVVVKQFHDDSVSDSIRKLDRLLIKSHGSADNPKKLIFTRTEYAQARNKHSSFYELLDALLRTHTFLFLGCGLDDPDIRLLLENYCYRHPEAPSHYFVTMAGTLPPAVRDVFEDSLRIKILEYKKSTDHSHLVADLEALVARVERERTGIATL